jgi:hypothetical protein
MKPGQIPITKIVPYQGAQLNVIVGDPGLPPGAVALVVDSVRQLCAPRVVVATA